MSIALAHVERYEPFVLTDPIDDFVIYWRAVLTRELLGTEDFTYARELRRMLHELSCGAVVLPRRCRMCGRFFDQPLGAGHKWQRFCKAVCRKQFPRKVLK
jgi:hypothetical protein